MAGCFNLLPAFQSHNGAIAARGAMTTVTDVTDVSIPQWCDCCQIREVGEPFEVGFQSHNGAIAATNLTHILTAVLMFQSHNGAIAAKAKFWGLRAKGKEMVKGLQSTFGCLKTLRGRRQLGFQNWAILG